MTVETASDRLNEFLDLNDFAEEVIWNGKKVQAIFDNISEIGGSIDIAVYSRSPMLTVRDEDIIDIQQNDIVIVRGTDYKVMKTEPDGTGITEIRLKLA